MLGHDETGETRSPFDRSACPFCGRSLDEPGVGFLAHLRRRSDCEHALTRWREGREETAADAVDAGD